MQSVQVRGKGDGLGWGVAGAQRPTLGKHSDEELPRVIHGYRHFFFPIGDGFGAQRMRA